MHDQSDVGLAIDGQMSARRSDLAVHADTDGLVFVLGDSVEAVRRVTRHREGDLLSMKVSDCPCCEHGVDLIGPWIHEEMPHPWDGS